MKIIGIGDIHGRQKWKQAIIETPFDKVVIMGDYFDNHYEKIPAIKQIDNFMDMLAFKRKHMERCEMLIGNHDFHYLTGVTAQYSGFQKSHRLDYRKILEGAINEGLIKMCYTHSNPILNMNFAFTHAGITKTWCQNHNVDPANFRDTLNDLLLHKPLTFRFSPGPAMDKNGDEVCQSPIWVRPASLLKDKIDNWIQVVGHTAQDEITFQDDVFFIDTLGAASQYLILDDSGWDVKRAVGHFRFKPDTSSTAR